ncbi:hypothetical protein BU23DRAFT_559588 [Bimuria novae-zelandiae CBS 107.79]|uniref:Uncharacterized protein n=1 Tax=Bimuria novae-zelandiae CBS 107.79 TaxID=1447943 RepID=A0A6A5URW1_9PLEO|nr:hypothetical protein BU23DRAFT_559588 [Bimuria novae-zelandiae CBS 107.79]
MRFGIAFSALIAAATAAPAAAPAVALDPAPPVGSSCTCGAAPNFVYSRCFSKPDGSTVIYLCQTSCTWQSTGVGCS